MATDTGTVELPPETTDESAFADAQNRISEFLAGDPEEPQKSPEQEPAPEEKPSPQETEPTPETEPEVPPTAEDAPKTDDGLPPDVQERIDKRIDQLTAKRREAEEALEATRAEMESLRSKVKELTETTREPQAQLPPDADPVLRVPEINKIWQEEQKYADARRDANTFLREYEDNPDGVLEKMQARMPKAGFTTAKQVKFFLEDVKDDASMKLSQLRSQRESASSRHVQRMEKEAEKFHDQAVKSYPEVLDKNSPMGKQIAEIARTMPALFNASLIPNGWEIATDLAAGRLQRLTKAAAPAAKPTPPKLPVPGKAVSTASVTRPTNGKAESALKKQAAETGDVRDIARFLEKSPVFS